MKVLYSYVRTDQMTLAQSMFLQYMLVVVNMVRNCNIVKYYNYTVNDTFMICNIILTIQGKIRSNLVESTRYITTYFFLEFTE